MEPRDPAHAPRARYDLHMTLAQRVTKLLTPKKKTSTTTKVLLGAGATLAVAGAVGAALKVAADKKAKATALIAKDDAAAKARMEGEGGAMKPVTAARRAKRAPARRK